MTNKVFLLVVLIALPIHVLGGGPRPRKYQGIPGLNPSFGELEPRTTLEERECCENMQSSCEVPNRGNTTREVDDLLVLMQSSGFQAYIVPSADAHLSEYTADADERREFISDFTGSAGTAVILGDGQRALWTDGRYFLQAEQELDCTWILMKSGEPGVPSITEWLLQEVPAGGVVGADARLFASSSWLGIEANLSPDLTLEVEIIGPDGFNIVDDVWINYGRPAYPLDEIFVHDLQYCGQVWPEKIAEMEAEMAAENTQLFVVTMLDENAWLLNLRGNDIAYNPYFRSYIILDTTAGSPASVSLFVPDIATKVPQDVYDHLNIGDCSNITLPCVGLYDYDNIGTALSDLANQASVTGVLIPNSASYYIYDLVPSEKRVTARSPIMEEKALKNPIEQENMKIAQIKDATAMYQFLYFMDTEMAAGNDSYTEISAMTILDNYRYLQPESRGLSFNTISAYGANAAVIHYSPTEETDTPIGYDNVYLVDSGGQYPEGTTDITRTLHYGTPDPIMIEAYTRVLMGHIDMATLTFPVGTSQSVVDILTRRPLYAVGWDFNHGPDHGVGQYLGVHEGSDGDLRIGFHTSDEPGYYQEGDFGVRIESMVAVVNVTTKYHFFQPALGFEMITLVHYEEKLIDTSLLTSVQCDFVNSHYANIQAIMGPHLLNEGLQKEYDYMITKTQPLNC